MAEKDSPSIKYKWRTPPKEKEKSYTLRMNALTGGNLAKGRLAAYNRRIKERKMKANKVEWQVEGKNFNRYRMMEYIVAQTANGDLLSAICEPESMPSMLEVYSWFSEHPAFEKEFKIAEMVRGHRLGDEVEEIARGTDRENVAADKLKTEVLSKAAARLNARFQDKQLVETKDEYSGLSEDQLKNRIRLMLQSNPDLQAMIPAGLLGERQAVQEIDLQPLELSVPSLDCVPDDTHEPDDK